MKKNIKYNRILLKISGEALKGSKSYGIDYPTIKHIAQEIKKIHKLNIKIAIVIGGGNFFRGFSERKNIERKTGDKIGMLSTIINSLTMQDQLEKISIQAKVLSAISVNNICETYEEKKANNYLKKNKIIILAAGMGNPYFTTDTAASLRAIEIRADIILKATKVNGVYDKDPILHKNAKIFKKIKYIDIINKKISIMDLTSISLCMENNVKICVFNINEIKNIQKILIKENIGTFIS